MCKNKDKIWECWNFDCKNMVLQKKIVITAYRWDMVFCQFGREKYKRRDVNAFLWKWSYVCFCEKRMWPHQHWPCPLRRSNCRHRQSHCVQAPLPPEVSTALAFLCRSQLCLSSAASVGDAVPAVSIAIPNPINCFMVIVVLKRINVVLVVFPNIYDDYCKK